MPPATTLTDRDAPELRIPTDRLDAFSRVLEAVGDLPTATDADAALGRIAERLRELVPFTSFAILLCDPDAGDHGNDVSGGRLRPDRELRFRYAEGLPDDVVENWRFGMGQGLIGRAADEGARRAGGEESGDGTRDLLPGLRSELAVPLDGRQRMVGVLDLGSDAADAFTDDDLHLVELVARHLGRTIESSWAHHRARRLARNLSLLQEASRGLASILDRDKLLESIADIVRRLIDYELFSVMLWNDDEECLETVFDRRSLGCGIVKNRLYLGEGLTGSAAALRRPVRVGNVGLDPRYVQCGDERVRSELVLPLLFEDRLLGVLDIESYEYDAFTAEHEQILQTLASNVAVALENSELYQRLRDDERRLDRDLTTAREVQRFLLPRRSPWVPGLQVGFANVPARHLGGDVYDFYPYGDGRMAFAVGDVAGKGTGAALYGSLTIGLLRGYATDTQCGPACLMGYLDEELRQLDLEKRFLAFSFAVYDAGRLTWANAGLPYPWLVRDGKARELEVGGLPLGSLGHFDRETGRPVPRPEESLELEPGDFVVFATDGLDECRDADGEPFGEERVRRVLERHAGGAQNGAARDGSAQDISAQDVADALLRATDRHLGDRPPSDDRTALVLKVAG